MCLNTTRNSVANGIVGGEFWFCNAAISVMAVLELLGEYVQTRGWGV